MIRIINHDLDVLVTLLHDVIREETCADLLPGIYRYCACAYEISQIISFDCQFLTSNVRQMPLIPHDAPFPLRDRAGIKVHDAAIDIEVRTGKDVVHSYDHDNAEIR